VACGGGTLRKIGEDVIETLELIPRQWKVIQHVREKFYCRACKAITQPAPSHPIARGRAGPKLLAHVLFSKYSLHLPLNRQSAPYAREGIDLDVSTLADWVGAAAATLMPLVKRLGRISSLPNESMPTTRVCQSWARSRPAPADCGPMCA
jgi:transposase